MANWGILAPGRIAHKFVSDFQAVDNGTITAVASRSMERAGAFAKKFNIKNAYDSYEQLVRDDEVEVIYIATTHNFHYENAILCLENNKSILCEKPITVNAGQLTRLIDLASEKKLFLMEAMWTYFLPAINKALEWVKTGKIGAVKMIKADFGFQGPSYPLARILNPELAGGALLDVGIYPLSIAELMADAPIESIHAEASIGKTKVDESNSMLLKYKNGILAQLSSSVVFNLNNDAYIFGTEGHIRIPLFWMAKKAILTTNDGTEIFEDDRKTFGYNFQAVEVNDLLEQGEKESKVMPLAKSLKMMQLMDNIRKTFGVKYPFEI